MVAGVRLSVTFATGLVMLSSNQVARIVTLRAAAIVTPRSRLFIVSGPSWALAVVSVVPTRNCRYNSFSVGARNPPPMSPHTLSALVS